MSNALVDLIDEQALPSDFNDTVTRWYQPLARAIAERRRLRCGTLVVGVQGCQGSGKSTLASFLKCLLETHHQQRCTVLSIDDFYLTRNERQTLAEQLHPLFITRGVPGTHDVKLALEILTRLCALSPMEHCAVPRFDKARDDRAEPSAWECVGGPVDVVIFEGWCVGLEAQDETDLAMPVNRLEREEDADGRWRHHVNRALAGAYATLFARLDYLITLCAPDFDCVLRWRTLQEDKLRARLSKDHAAPGLMNAAQLERFIAHYQRLTEHALRSLPARADGVLSLNEAHSIVALDFPLRGEP